MSLAYKYLLLVVMSKYVDSRKSDLFLDSRKSDRLRYRLIFFFIFHYRNRLFFTIFLKYRLFFTFLLSISNPAYNSELDNILTSLLTKYTEVNPDNINSVFDDFINVAIIDTWLEYNL